MELINQTGVDYFLLFYLYCYLCHNQAMLITFCEYQPEKFENIDYGESRFWNWQNPGTLLLTAPCILLGTVISWEYAFLGYVGRDHPIARMYNVRKIHDNVNVVLNKLYERISTKIVYEQFLVYWW